MSWLGLDVGGANLKIADGNGYAQSVAFPLWRQPERLSDALHALITHAPAAERLALTMTGELADCFANKAEGVAAILDAVGQATAELEVLVYLCDGRLVPMQTARAEARLAAASNWHVLASFAARYCNRGSALLIDLGSTTCDLIPLAENGPNATGKTDPERLIAGELLYTGVERSPLCALVSELPWRGASCPVAQELFATTADVYLLLGELPEDEHRVDTADGRPRTIEFAHARVARMICADVTMFSHADAIQAATALREKQASLLALAVQRVIDHMPELPATIVLSGQGEFLSRRAVAQLGTTGEVVSLSELIGTLASRAACAHALAVVAQEWDVS